MAFSRKHILISKDSFLNNALFIGVLFSGLSAGLFYSWSVSVIPGTMLISDAAYLESMKSINREILNPIFYLVFFGTPILLMISLFGMVKPSLSFSLIVISVLLYFLGTILVTGLGNVPLNDELEIININELNAERLNSFRKYYELNWNRLHQIRTVFAILSFTSALLSIFIKKIKN